MEATGLSVLELDADEVDILMIHREETVVIEDLDRLGVRTFEFIDAFSDANEDLALIFRVGEARVRFGCEDRFKSCWIGGNGFIPMACKRLRVIRAENGEAFFEHEALLVVLACGPSFGDGFSATGNGTDEGDREESEEENVEIEITIHGPGSKLRSGVQGMRLGGDRLSAGDDQVYSLAMDVSSGSGVSRPAIHREIVGMGTLQVVLRARWRFTGWLTP